MNPETVSSLLHHCSKVKAFRPGTSLHATVMKLGIQSDIIVSNHVLNMYAKCGSMKLARQVFDGMPEKNIVSWSAMISGYDQNREPLMGIELFSKMGVAPNEFVLASAITSCASLLALVQGQWIHAKALKFGYGVVSFVSNALISMYMKCGKCDDALSVHDNVCDPNSVSYNALVSGFVKNKDLGKGFEVFKSMYRKGFLPDHFTFVVVMGICTNIDDMQRGMGLHCQTVKLNFDSMAMIGNVIITMYSKFNLIDEAERAFKFIEDKDIISWNTLISACSHCDDHLRGLKIFKEMTRENGSDIDDFSFASVLASCAGFASIRHGKELHAHIIRLKPHQDVGVGNALVNMYAKCGCIGYAYHVFKRMDHRNLVSWNTIITGFGNHGLGEKSLQLFEQMKTVGVKPDSVTFTGLLTACNHSGLVDIGKSYFNSMNEVYGITPDIGHFTCLIDILGRAGRLSEAEDYMKKFSFGNDQIVLGSLLSACRIHKDVAIGEHLAERLLKLDPVTTSPYVLLSNLYASDEMWSGVAQARKMLRGRGLIKEPGHSLIEAKGNVEKFTVGDFSHSMMGEIKDMLKTLRLAASEVVDS